jgi:ribosomal protein S21
MSNNKHTGCEAEGVHKNGLTVRVIDNNIESAIRALKKRIIGEGVLKELGEKRFYEKPSVRKRRERAEAVNRARRERHTQNHN